MEARLPFGPEDVTDRQRQVAHLIAQDKTNREIAEALGISLDGAKYHVSELLGRLGLERREDVGAWYRTHFGWRSRLRGLLAVPFGTLLLGGGATAVVAVVIVTVVVLSSRSSADGGGLTSGERAVPFDTRAASLEYLAYDGDSLARAGLADAGLLLESSDGGPFEALYRTGWAAIRTTSDMWVIGSGIPGDGWAPGGGSSAFGASFTIVLDGERFFVSVSVVERGDFELNRRLVQFGGPGQVAFSVHDGTAEARVRVTNTDGRSYPSLVDADGRLWVAATERIRDEEVVAYDTGEWIDVSRLRRLADIHGGVPRPDGMTPPAVFCRPTGRCDVTAAAMAGAVHAPVSGALDCADGRHGQRVLQIASPDLVLELSPVMAAVTESQCADLPASVTAGEPVDFFGVYWNIRAETPTGEPLDAVMSRDGTLYVGDAQTSVRCPPCVPGS